MFRKILAAAAVVAAGAMVATTPVQAYDPCQRAHERVEEAEAAMRAYHRRCNYPACLYTVGFDRLVAEVNAAREQRRRACNG